MPPPRRHLLFQLKESDGDKFEKVLLRITLPGKLRRNSKYLQKVVEASERIFELAENTWAVFSTGAINTNQVCQARNMIQTRQINSGDTVTVEPGCYIRTMDHVISADES